ncbi:molybdenum cofactor biosynthesis protein MoaE [Anabaena sp. UHCC 0399]|uniref:molybdenum cofactor biosynthesis protein MoaE n=1 Tax=Anabaena sp. UHCC 0399 TaxID=3110238 RepID=UPI002B1EA15D|nr:molybdenum cofactor biosynthesis protein MoaE [Anabaena sp. UHCC 0399]MEA5565232.1 molybdenum cofactor biosynthesis protein MoaE [Anabaena sp. UHCC 0399]
MKSIITTTSAILKPRTEDSFAITFAPLSIDEIYIKASDPANGAVVLMSGMVRNQTDGKAVVSLEYQAYEPMALQVFYQIGADIRVDWPDVNRVVIHHRVGRLQIGEISVLVAVGCPHRGEAFAACRYAIDTLKHNAPIWKKEHWFDGSSTWVSIGACEESSEINHLPQHNLKTRPHHNINDSV